MENYLNEYKSWIDLRFADFHAYDEWWLKEWNGTEAADDRYNRKPSKIRCCEQGCDSTEYNHYNTDVENDSSSKPAKFEKNGMRKSARENHLKSSADGFLCANGWKCH